MIKANLVHISVPAVAKLGFESICLYYEFVVMFWVLHDLFDKQTEPTGKDRVNNTLCEERIIRIFIGEPLPHLSSK